jgi:hypothetical protein
MTRRKNQNALYLFLLVSVSLAEKAAVRETFQSKLKAGRHGGAQMVSLDLAGTDISAASIDLSEC